MKRWDLICDDISVWSGRIAAFVIYPGMLVLVYEVVARYAFNAPTIWAHGVCQRAFAIYLVIGAAYVLQQKGHIRMDLIYNRFSPRGKAIINLVTSPILFLIIFVLLWFGWDFAQTSISQLEIDNTPLHGPVWPFKLWIPITGFLLLVQAVANFYRDVVTLLHKGEQHES